MNPGEGENRFEKGLVRLKALRLHMFTEHS